MAFNVYCKVTSIGYFVVVFTVSKTVLNSIFDISNIINVPTHGLT